MSTYNNYCEVHNDIMAIHGDKLANKCHVRSVLTTSQI